MENLVVPDDASSLFLDEKALARERKAAARRTRYRRLIFTRRYDRFGISGPIVFLVLLLVGLTAGAAVVLLAPVGEQAAPALQPLAAAPVGAAIGDLLPAAQLSVRGTSREAERHDVHDVRDLRPSVVVLLPVACPTCRPDMEQLIVSSHSHGLRVHAVLPTEPTDLATELTLVAEPPTGGGSATLDVDTSGLLTQTYPTVAGHLTVLVVGADGVLIDVRPGWTAADSLTSLDQAAGLR